MKKITFEIEIKASTAKVWQVLWNDVTYRQWTGAFQEGSYAVSDWNEGSGIHFLSPDGGGMYSVIDVLKPKEFMAFKHLGVLKNFEEQPLDEETKTWSGGMEVYTLKEEGRITTLIAELDAIESFEDYFKETFPKALARVKELAEKPIFITVETKVKAPVEKVWENWTKPEHIMKWNNASADWHTPNAENDLRIDGKFTYKMAAKDGSVEFDFWGVYTDVKTNEKIAYTLGDERRVKIEFAKQGDGIQIIQTFEAEEINSLELQKTGWQAIMDNFKTYTQN